MVTAHVFISGFVQGVGYRQFVRKNAEMLGLTGWVKNLPDDRVEAVFQSSASSDQEGKKHIEQMIGLCKKGPFLADVKDITVKWREADPTFQEFVIEKS